MLLDKSDVSRLEIPRIIEAMQLITNMCLHMSIDLSCKPLNLHILISIDTQDNYNFILSYTRSRNKMGRNMLLFFTLCSKRIT